MITWCSFCNSKPAEGELHLYSRSFDEIQPYPACKVCVAAVKEGKLAWVTSELE